METSELITTGIALWGAGLSTILAIKGFFRDKRSLKVTCNLAISSDNFGNPITLISVGAINRGHRPITITGGGLLLNDQRLYVQPFNKNIPTKLPARLEDGESISIYLDLHKIREWEEELAQQKVQFISAFVSDAEGKKYVVKLSHEMRSLFASSPRNP